MKKTAVIASASEATQPRRKTGLPRRACALLAMTILSYSLPAHAAQVKEVVSPKGFKAWLVEDHSLPLLAVKISFTGSGYAYDPEDEQGRANLTAAMLMEGAGDLNQREFNQALDAHAIRLSAGAGEDTIDLAMETTSEHKALAMKYAGMAMAEPRFDDGAFSRARSQALAVLRQQEQTPGYLLAQAFKKAAFGNHPYGRPQVGTQDTLDSISASDLRRVQERFLTRENIVIGAAGDITPDELARLMDEHFDKLPKRYDPDTKLEEATVAAAGDPVVMAFDIPQTMVMFGLQGLKRDDPNYIAAYVMNHILGGGSLTSILGQELRDDRGLTYSVGTYLEPMQRGALWRGAFASRNEDARKAVNVLLATLKVFAQQGPTDKEIADAKRFLVDSFALNLDSNPDLAGFLVTMQINRLGIDYMDRRNSMVSSVQKAQIMDMAKRLIDPDKMLLMMIGKPVTQQQEQEKAKAAEPQKPAEPAKP